MRQRLMAIYGRLIKVPVLGWFVATPVRAMKRLLGAAPPAVAAHSGGTAASPAPSLSSLEMELLASAMTSLRADARALSERLETVERQNRLILDRLASISGYLRGASPQAAEEARRAMAQVLATAPVSGRDG